MNHRISFLISAVLVALVALPVAAQQSETQNFEITYSVSHRVQEGGQSPTLTFESPMALRDASVTLSRAGGWSRTEEYRSLYRGQRQQVSIDQPAGTYEYLARIKGDNNEGQEISFEFRFEIIVVEEIEVEIDRDRIDIGQGKIPIQVNRPVEKVEITIQDPDGRRLLSRTQSFSSERGLLNVEWQPRGEVGSIRLQVHDIDGFWTAVVIEPFWVEIEHQTVNFNFGTATWDESEEPKLQETLRVLQETRAARAQYGAELRLYIAGYTDTVGSASSNVRLSTRRAQAIATWFKENGVEMPIYYQGFGQSVLAVETPDETEEAQNRRALYILGNAAPPTSEQIPQSNWQRLR